MEIQLKLERVSTNKLNDKKLEEMTKEIAGAAKNRPTANGVDGFLSPVTGPKEVKDGYKYSFIVKLKKEKFRSETAATKCLEAARKFVTAAAEVRQWKVLGESKAIEEKRIALENRSTINVEPLTDEVMDTYFAGVYEREAHIRMIHYSVKTAVETNFDERNHLLLYGKPAAAKTVLFRKLKAWYESKDPSVERVAMINSVTLSKAGLENWILDKAQSGLLPEILCFDEIEKFNMDNLSCLLGIMDEQATISRNNAKIGNQSAEAKCIIWATCNDLDKLKEFNKGALFSRFTKALPCVRPSKELMLEIMVKKLEVRQAKGIAINKAWAKAAVDYAFDKQKCNDPRKIAALLDGGDALLDGTYFRDLKKIDDAYQLDMKHNLS